MRAPTLYGRQYLEGNPAAYIMEELGQDWMTLHEFGKKRGQSHFRDLQ